MKDKQGMISKNEEEGIDGGYENAAQRLNQLNEELDGLQATLLLELSAMYCSEKTYKSELFWEVATMISYTSHQRKRFILRIGFLGSIISRLHLGDF